MAELRTDRTDGAAAATGVARTTARENIARPFAGRPLVVVMGMHRSGASVLAKMLQLLGVDMTDAGADRHGPDAAPWERPEIVAFNTRLLEIVGRPLGHPAHALPFPPGWWGAPAVQAVKRDAQAYLRRTLEDRYGLWGFKDLRVTRLLPFWQQVFDELGLRPVWLWAVRDPAASAASVVRARLAATPEIAEAMWFIYNAEAQKFVGEEAAAIIDYVRWADAPAAVVEELLDRLPLTWRGSSAELLECVRAMAPPSARDAGPPPTLQSPLVQNFFQAVRDPDGSDKSRRVRGSVTQAVDILRTLVSPYAALVEPSASVAVPALPPAADPAPALLLAQQRATEAEGALAETEELLSREIEARGSENAWLKQQYLDGKRLLAEKDEQLRGGLSGGAGENARLRLELDEEALRRTEAERRLAEVAGTADRQRVQLKEELDQVRRELALQRAANEKYLSRIYELRASLKTGEGAPAAGSRG